MAALMGGGDGSEVEGARCKVPRDEGCLLSDDLITICCGPMIGDGIPAEPELHGLC
jgi:hypothetical protein